MNLFQAIERISYSQQWGIWASLDEEGKFSPDSEARYGQKCFENGGMIDNLHFFGNGENIQEFLSEWGDIDELIENFNEQFKFGF